MKEYTGGNVEVILEGSDHLNNLQSRILRFMAILKGASRWCAKRFPELEVKGVLFLEDNKEPLRVGWSILPLGSLNVHLGIRNLGASLPKEYVQVAYKALPDIVNSVLEGLEAENPEACKFFIRELDFFTSASTSRR